MANSQHQIVETLPTATRKSRDSLVNWLNNLHYQNTPCTIQLKHASYNYNLMLKAVPLPSASSNIKAEWIQNEDLPPDFSLFHLESILIPGPRHTFEVHPQEYWLDETGVSFPLPSEIEELHNRQTGRYGCLPDIEAVISQNSIFFKGDLLDFSAMAMRMEAYSDDQPFSWLNFERQAILGLTRQGKTFFSAHVTVTRRNLSEDGHACTLLLQPAEKSTPRFLPKKFRARRGVLSPAPHLIFCHPITGRKCILKISDLGAQGLSVEEDSTRATLVSGLILTQAEICLADSFRLTCTLQVVYHGRNGGEGMRSGLALLNMNPRDHLRLVSLVQQMQNDNIHISTRVDADDLFEFFFDTGFLYPGKYQDVAQNPLAFKEACKRLYEHDVDIARHFVYLQNNEVQGHFSTIRVYKNTWMNHHHAARKSSRVGLKVVRAISEYINDVFSLKPANIKYIIGFFRPNNKFPNKYFGGFVKKVKNLSYTSLDAFGYIHKISDIIPNSISTGKLGGKWDLAKAARTDMVEFNGYYQNCSGGLLTKALDLTPQTYDDQSLKEAYEADGLHRERSLYALRYNNQLKALIEVQQSDLGLNLSELTNATFVYILDSLACQRDILELVLAAVGIKHQKMEHPVMFFPDTYPADVGLEINKTYTLWAMDLDCGEDYMAWMEQYCRF